MNRMSKLSKTNKNTWYFSGNEERIDNHGVGVVIRNELRNYVHDV